eukprot:gb/GEZN01001623.1/.p1 GENE.gb/GEZN01001623.1/~~gb/GEZN01001623.1/.p1  ORF type:complete len:882 (-),score=116.39 gb/GEZN01001623.1/:78-2723(-)
MSRDVREMPAIAEREELMVDTVRNTLSPIGQRKLTPKDFSTPTRRAGSVDMTHAAFASASKNASKAVRQKSSSPMLSPGGGKSRNLNGVSSSSHRSRSASLSVSPREHSNPDAEGMVRRASNPMNHMSNVPGASHVKTPSRSALPSRSASQNNLSPAAFSPGFVVLDTTDGTYETTDTFDGSVSHVETHLHTYPGDRGDGEEGEGGERDSRDSNSGNFNVGDRNARRASSQSNGSSSPRESTGTARVSPNSSTSPATIRRQRSGSLPTRVGDLAMAGKDKEPIAPYRYTSASPEKPATPLVGSKVVRRGSTPTGILRGSSTRKNKLHPAVTPPTRPNGVATVANDSVLIYSVDSSPSTTQHISPHPELETGSSAANQDVGPHGLTTPMEESERAEEDTIEEQPALLSVPGVLAEVPPRPSNTSVTHYRSRGFTEILQRDGPVKPFIPPSPVIVKGEHSYPAREVAAQEQKQKSISGAAWPGPERASSLTSFDHNGSKLVSPFKQPGQKHIRASSVAMLPSDALEVRQNANTRPRSFTTEQLETHKAALRYSMSFQAIQEIRSKALAWEQLEDMKLLAAGMFGEVHTASYRNYQVVVKTLKPIIIPPNSAAKQERRLRQEQKLAVADFKKEMSMLTKLWHPNIVSLVGVGISPKLFMVMEFMRGGSLKEILSRCRERETPLEPEMTMHFALDCARGMLYLHEAFPRILHRDLKPANLLITGVEPGEDTKDSPRPRLKIADFGLSRVLGPDKHHEAERYKLTGGTGSLRYMAPEVAANQPYNEKADVYGFGIILWEMVANDLPYKTLHTHNFYKEVVRRRMRPPLYDLKQSTEMLALIQDSWDHEPDRRPTFREIIKRLEYIRDHTDFLGVKPSPLARCCVLM